MPSGEFSVLGQRKKKWSGMLRWERKEFHRMNEIRRIEGKEPLVKP